MKTLRARTVILTLALALLIGAAPAFHPSLAASAPAEVPGWVQRNTSGFGLVNNWNVSTLDEFGDQLYAGTFNHNGAQVWRSNDGKTWNKFTPPYAKTNIYLNDTQPFQDQLYASTGSDAGPGEIWRTDGNTWNRVAANGLGDVNNVYFDAFAVFGDQLYVTTGNLTTGIEIWRSPSGNLGSWEQVNQDGFGNPTWTYAVTETFADKLWVGIARTVGTDSALAELWYTSNGTDWNPAFTDGLGDPNNIQVSSLAVYEGYLYAGLRNEVDGGEVWRTQNGSDWEQVVDAGLGNPNNQRPYGLFVFGERLYLVYSNLVDGAEVWSSADGETWRQEVSGGWGDPANQFADLLDKGAAVFKDSLYIGTWNKDTGGQIWMQQHQVAIPLAVNAFPLVGCTTIPTLLGPANGAQLNNLIPLYEWNAGDDPNVDLFRLDVALDAGFTNFWSQLYSGQDHGYGRFRFPRNLNPATTYYWRAFLMCGDNQGPYSAAHSFRSGSGGTLLPASDLIAPADGTHLSGTGVTMKWSSVGGAVEYIVRWRELGEGGYTYGWVNATEYENNWLDNGLTYEWWVSARNEYAIGADSDAWTFYTPAQAFGEPKREMLDKADMVIDENGNWYLSPSMEK